MLKLKSVNPPTKPEGEIGLRPSPEYDILSAYMSEEEEPRPEVMAMLISLQSVINMAFTFGFEAGKRDGETNEENSKDTAGSTGRA